MAQKRSPKQQQQQQHPTVEFMMVTPDMALEWLTGNTHNRSLRNHGVELLARDITAGRWEPTAGTIHLTWDGVVLNGQHRLHAVIETDTAVEMIVITGCPLESQRLLDNPLHRSFGDVLKLEGENNWNALSSALSYLNWYQATGGKLTAGGTPSAARATRPELMELLEKNPELRTSVAFGRRVYTGLGSPKGLIAAMHFVLQAQCEDESWADTFFDSLATGANLSEDDPIYALRKVYLADRLSQKKMRPAHRVALLIKAWNLWVAGETVNILRWRAGGPNPEKFPTPVRPEGELDWPAA